MIDPAHLADIEEIRQLKARYFRYLDTKQWDEWRKIFTENFEFLADGTVEQDGHYEAYPHNPKGADAFVAHVSNVFKPPFKSVHHGHTAEISIIGPETATAIWAMEDIISPSPDVTIWGYGYYHERYRKVGGQWLIEGFHLKRIRFDNGPGPSE